MDLNCTHKINFLGDSITEGHGVTSDEGYVGVIASKTGATCRNYGISGTRIAKQHTPSIDPNWDLDFCSRVALMDADADVIVVLGGTNDYGHGNAVIGAMEDRTPDTFYGALHTLYSSLINKYPRSVIVICTPLHRLDEETGISPNGLYIRAYTLKSYVNAIREVAEYYSLPVADLYANSGLQPMVDAVNHLYFLDGLHPNRNGHQVIANQILSFLQAYPNKKCT